MDRRGVVCLIVCWASTICGAFARDQVPPGPPPGPGSESTGKDSRLAPEQKRSQDLIDRYKRILVKKPTQDWAFDKLFRLHVELNTVKELVDEYRALAKESPDDQVPAIVLARLHHKTDEPLKAVEILTSIKEPDREVLFLLSRIHLASGALSEALAILERAAAMSSTRQQKMRTYELLGEVYLRNRQKDKAVETWRKIAAENPDNAYTRQKLAEIFSRHSLWDHAEQEYQALLKVVGDNPSRACAIRHKLGALYEKQFKFDRALEIYKGAISLMSAGNWMRKDMIRRIVSIHRGRNSVDELAAYCEKSLRDNPNQRDSYDILSSLYVEAGRHEEAEKVLRRCMERYPSDAGLSKALRRVLQDAGRNEEVVTEFHRILDARPDDAELYVELGAFFARTQQLARASLQWRRLLDEKIKSPDLCVRLANVLLSHKQTDEAERAFKKALTLDPAHASARRGLAELYLSSDRVKEGIAELRHALARFPDNADKRVETAKLLVRLRLFDEALKVVDEALALAPSNPGALLGRAEVLLLLDRKMDAAAAYRSVAEADATEHQRRRALETLVNLYYTSGKLDELMQDEQARFEQEPTLVSGTVLILCHRRALTPGKALGVYEKLVEAYPNDVPLLESFARDLGRLEMTERGVDTFHRLAELNPAKKRTYLKAAANIYIKDGDYLRAEQEIGRMLASGGNNRFAFKEAAALRERMGDSRGALEMMLRAVQLAPDDAKLNSSLAKKCRQAGQIERAIRYYRVALRHESKFRRKSRILRYLYDMHTSQGTLDRAVEEYEEAVQGNPYDVQSQLALAHFLLFHGDHVEALEKIKGILKFVPQDIDLRWMLVEIHAALEEYEEAIAECRRMLDIPKINRDAVHERIGKGYFTLGRRVEALVAWKEIAALRKRAKLFDSHEMPEEAIEVYRELIASRPMEPKHYKGLAKIFVSRDRNEEALKILAQLRVLDPDDIYTLGSIGDIHAHADRRDKSLEIGRKIISVLRKDKEDEEDEDEDDDDDDEPDYRRSYRYARYRYQQASPVSASREYFFRNGLRKEFVEILFEEVQARPDNIKLAFESLGAFRGEHGIEKGVALLRSLVKREIDISQIPKAMRYGDPKDMLWNRLKSVLQTPTLMEKALADYREKIKAGEALESPQHYIIYAGMLSSQNRLDEALGALEYGMRHGAGREILRAHRAAALMRTKRYADAAEEYRAVLEATLEQPPRDIQELLKKRMKDTFSSLPARQRAVVRDEHRDYFRRCLSFQIRQGFAEMSMTRLPGAAYCRRRLAYAHYKLGDRDLARELIEAQMPGDVRTYAPYGQLAAVCVEGEDEELSLRISEAALAHWKYLRNWLPQVLVKQIEWSIKQELGDLSRLAQLYTKREEYVKAYDILRRHGSQDSYYYGGGGERETVFAFIKRHDIAEELVSFYEKRKEEAALTYEERKAGLDRFPTREERDAFERARNRVVEEGIALAEVHQSESKFAAAATEYESLLELDPDFASLYQVLVILHKKLKDYAAAAKVQESYISYIRARQADPHKDEERISPLLKPTMPTDEDQAGSSSRYGGYSRSYSRYSRSYGGYSPWRQSHRWGPELAAAHHELAWIYLKAEQKDEALAALASYVKTARTSAEEAFVKLSEFAEESGLKDEVFAMQRSLAGRNPHNLLLNMLHLGVLKERKRYHEALNLARAMQRSTRATSSSQGHLAQLTKIVEDLGRHTGAAPAPKEDLSSETIRRKAEENPEDPAALIRLAKALYTETRFPEALDVTDSIKALAPHHPENMALRRKLFEILKMHDAWIAFKKERLAKLKVNARYSIYKELADHFTRRGLEEDAAKMFKKMIDPKNNSDLNSALVGLLRMRKFGQVLKAFDQMERGAGYQYRGGDLDKSKASVLLAMDKEDEAVELYRKSIKKPSQRGYRSSRWGEQTDPFWKTFASAGKLDLIGEVIKDEATRNPRNTVALRRARQWMHYLRRDDDELAACEALLELNDKDDSALFDAMLLSDKKEDLEEFEKYLRKMLALNEKVDQGQDPNAMMARMMMNRGMSSEPSLDQKGEYLWALGKLALMRGNREEALERFNKIRKPDRPGTSFVLASILTDESLHDEALVALNECIKKTAQLQPYHYTALLKALLKKGDLKEAYATAKKRHELFLSSSLKNTYYSWNQSDRPTLKDKALYNLAKATGNIDEYLTFMRKDAARDRSNIALQMELAAACAREGLKKEQLEFLHVLAVAHPKNPQVQNMLLGHYEAERDWDTCAKLLAKQIEALPGNKELRQTKLVAYLLRQQKDDEAAALLRKVAEEKNDSNAYLGLASWFAKRERFDEARESLEKAISLADRKEVYYLDYARLLSMAGDVDEAIRHIHMAIKKDQSAIHPPTEDTGLHGALWGSGMYHGGRNWRSQEKGGYAFRLLRALYRKSDLDEEMRAATEERPDDKDALYDMAIIHEAHDEPTEALALYSRLHELEPHNLKFVDKGIFWLKRLERYEEMRPWLEKAAHIQEHGIDRLADETYRREFILKTFGGSGGSGGSGMGGMFGGGPSASWQVRQRISMQMSRGGNYGGGESSASAQQRRTQVGNIVYEQTKDLSKAMLWWREMMWPSNNYFGGYGRNNVECHLLNRGLGSVLIDRADLRALETQIGNSYYYSGDSGFKTAVAVAHLATGDFAAFEKQVSRWLKPHRQENTGYNRSRFGTPSFAYGSGPRISRDIAPLYWALREHGQFDRFVEMLMPALRENHSESNARVFLDMVAYHLFREKLYDQHTDFVREHYPSKKKRDRRAQDVMLYGAATERKDWREVVRLLRSGMEGTKFDERFEMLGNLALVYETGLEDFEAALKTREELQRMRNSSPPDFHQKRIIYFLEQEQGYGGFGRSYGGGGRALRGVVLQKGDQENQRDSGYNYSQDQEPYGVLADDSDDDYWYYYWEDRREDSFKFIVQPQNNDWQANQYLQVAAAPGRILSQRQQRTLELAIGERGSMLFQLLKLGRVTEASALAKELLALRPARVDADPDALEASLLDRVAMVYSNAYDRDKPATREYRLEAERLRALSREKQRALIERHTWCAIQRREALRELENSERSEKMARAREFGSREEFERLFQESVEDAAQEQRELQVKGEEGRGDLMMLATSLVEAPESLLKLKDLDMAEQVLDAIEPADSSGMRFLRGVIKARRGDAHGAVEIFDALIDDSRKARERARARERWLGTGNVWLRYREPYDLFEQVPLKHLLLMASAYRRAGKARTAKLMIEKADEQDPKHKNKLWLELKGRAR